MITWIKANPIATLFIVALIIGIGVWVYNKFFKGANGDARLRNDEQERPVDIATDNGGGTFMQSSLQNIANSIPNNGGTGAFARTDGGKANL